LPKSLVFIAFSTGEWFLEKLELNVENDPLGQAACVKSIRESINGVSKRRNFIYTKRTCIYD
jgi:hypothetical protein